MIEDNLLIIIEKSDFVTFYCNIFAILKAGSEPVISFLNKANLFTRVCLFCISVRNKIYVIENDVLEPVVLARKHKSGKAPILMLDCIISQLSPELR